MNKKTIFLSAVDIVISLVLIYCLVVTGVWAYLKFFGPEKSTEDVAYIDSIITDTGEKKKIFEVVYYSNADNSGAELFELKITSFTDYEKKETYSVGIQILGNAEFKQEHNTKLFSNSFANTSYYLMPTNNTRKNTYFYNIDNNTNIAYERTKAINNNDFITLELDNKIYALKFGKSTIQSNWFMSSYNVTNIYTLVNEIYTGIKSLGYGTNSIEFKLTNIFDIQELNNRNQYVNVNDAEVFNTYCYMNVTKYKEGAKTYQNSMFKNVQGNSNWILKADEILNEYVVDKSIYYLTEQDFIFNYDNNKNYHVATLNKNAYNFLKNKNLNISLILNNDYLKSNSIVFGEFNNLYFDELGITNYYIINNNVKSEVPLC